MDNRLNLVQTYLEITIKAIIMYVYAYQYFYYQRVIYDFTYVILVDQVLFRASPHTSRYRLTSSPKLFSIFVLHFSSLDQYPEKHQEEMWNGLDDLAWHELVQKSFSATH